MKKLESIEGWELTDSYKENHDSGCCYQSCEKEFEGKSYNATAVLQSGEIEDIIDIEEND